MSIEDYRPCGGVKLLQTFKGLHGPEAAFSAIIFTLVVLETKYGWRVLRYHKPTASRADLRLPKTSILD
jgi:hypothetical protein